MAIRVPSGDLYADLGVRATASPEEISAAFRALARVLHPDVHPDPHPEAATAERFKTVSAAYRVLSDPAARARYDATRLDMARPAPVKAAPAPPVTARVPDPPAQPMVLGWEMTRKRAHWVLGAGVACLVLAIAVTGWVLGDPKPGAGDQTGRTVTLWLVAAKLLVGGALAVWIARRRLRNPLR
jgi:hypothetical protein